MRSSASSAACPSPRTAIHASARPCNSASRRTSSRNSPPTSRATSRGGCRRPADLPSTPTPSHPSVQPRKKGRFAMANVGRELLDVPFPQMVQNLAYAIAKGQLALDRTSLTTARQLAREKVMLIQEVQEIIEPDFRTVDVNIRDEDGSPHTESIVVTGARVRFDSMDPEEFTLLQAGLAPTFYQFTETIIEVK